MKRLLILLLCISMLLPLVACDKGGTEQPAQPTETTEEADDETMRVKSLKVNNLVTPLGVDTTPTFRWRNGCTLQGKSQSAYQIIVASTKELAEAGTGDVWDSGKTQGGDNFDITYGGNPLTSRTDYYWTVRIWDEKDEPTEWGEVARFGTGILDQSEWTAKWICGVQDYKAIYPAPMLRKTFDLSKAVKTAKVFISGLGLFELKINDIIPDNSVLNSAETQFDKTVNYCAYDVTKLLTQGKNAIAVELGCGYYNITDPLFSIDNASWRSNPKLLMELVVEYEDGTKETIASDETWKVYNDGPIRKDSLYIGETYDARKEVDGWTKADFDDSKWEAALTTAAPKGELKFANIEPMRRIKTLTPSKVEQKEDGAWLVTIPEFMTGWAKIAFDAPAGTQIKIGYYQIEREIETGLRASDVTGIQTYDYICKGVAGETYEPKFSYVGYQLIYITGYPGTLKPEDITCYTIATDVERIGAVETGNDLLNSLHDIMIRTMMCNMQGKPTDTPIFEKLGWTGDHNVVLDTYNFNFDISNFEGHFLNNLRDAQQADGFINEYTPAVRKSAKTTPSFTQMYINSIYAQWKANGNFSLAEDHYDAMRKHAQYHITELRLTGWIYANDVRGDWASPHGATQPSEGGRLVSTAGVYRNLKELAEMATAMGKTADAAEYEDAANNIYNAFNAYFYDKEKGYYDTRYWDGSTTRTQYRQTSNLIPLYYGLCPEEYRESVLNSLIEDIKSKNYHLDVGINGAEILLPLLSQEGYGDIGMKILMQTDYPSWGGWVKAGSTTTWERYDLSRSACHAFLGTYDEWFYSNLGGIQNPQNGYETVTVRPEVYKELGYVNISVKTVRGTLASSWKVDESGNVTMAITIPVGTTADILLPVAEGAAVQLNGAALGTQEGVIETGAQDGRVLVRVGSGTYNFDLGQAQIVG